MITPLRLFLFFLAVIAAWALMIVFSVIFMDFLLKHIFFVLGFGAGIALWLINR